MTVTLVILVLTVVMPEHVPDKIFQLHEPSIEQCWQEAKEFVAHGTPKQVEGAQAVMAACLVQERPET